MFWKFANSLRRLTDKTHGILLLFVALFPEMLWCVFLACGLIGKDGYSSIEEFGTYFMIIGAFVSTVGVYLIKNDYRHIDMLQSPKGRLLDAFLPPEDAEHRVIEMDEALARWTTKYGVRSAKLLYVWQSVVAICLFWFDRVVVRVLARK